MQQIEPAHAGGLIRAQFRLETRAGVDLCQALRAAQAAQHPGQPRAGLHTGPGWLAGLVSALCTVRTARTVRCVSGTVQPSPRKQAHRLCKRHAICAGALFDRPEAVEHALQFAAVDFDPLAAQQLQAIRAGQQFFDLGWAQGFTIERHFHREVEQGVLPEQ